MLFAEETGTVATTGVIGLVLGVASGVLGMWIKFRKYSRTETKDEQKWITQQRKELFDSLRDDKHELEEKMILQEQKWQAQLDKVCQEIDKLEEEHGRCREEAAVMRHQISELRSERALTCKQLEELKAENADLKGRVADLEDKK